MIEQKPCRRHSWLTEWHPFLEANQTSCTVCGKVRDEAASLRGKRAQRRGKRIQRERIRALGGENLGGSVPGLDGIGSMFRYESKSGRAFSEATWRVLRGIAAPVDQVRVLIVTSADGKGHKARSYVVVEFDDWRALHGEAEGAA